MGATPDSDGCCTGTYLTDPRDCPNSNDFLPGQKCCPGLAKWVGEHIKCWSPPTPTPTLHCTSSICMNRCLAASDCGPDESCIVMQSVPGPWGSPYSVCMGHNISNGRFCRSDDDCASKKCFVQETRDDFSGTCVDVSSGRFCTFDDDCASKKCYFQQTRDGFRWRCTDPTTTTTTLHCTLSDCMKHCQAALDCGEDQSCTAIFRTFGPWGGPYSVCMGHDISYGHFCLADDNCVSKNCSVQNNNYTKRGMCVGAPSVDGQTAWIGLGLSGAGVVAFGLIVGSAAMCLMRRHSKAREAGSCNHSLIPAFPKASAVTTRTQFSCNSPYGV